MLKTPSLAKEAVPRKRCADCGSTSALTRHHNEEGTICLCTVCHAKKHGAKENSFKKRTERLEKRVKREIEVLERLHEYLRKGK